MGTATIHKINLNLYSVSKKTHKDQSTRVKVITLKLSCLQMDDNAKDKTNDYDKK